MLALRQAGESRPRHRYTTPPSLRPLTAPADAPLRPGAREHPVRALAAAIRANPAMPERLRDALLAACHPGGALRTIDKLALAVGCNRRTLWNQWRQTVGPGAPLRLEDLLHWLLLYRAAVMHGAGSTWTDAAGQVGVHVHTLARFAHRFTGKGLRDLGDDAERAVAAALEREFLPRLRA